MVRRKERDSVLQVFVSMAVPIKVRAPLCVAEHEAVGEDCGGSMHAAGLNEMSQCCA